MKKTVFLFLLLIAFCQCDIQAPSGLANDFNFVSSPQEVIEQEIKTLEIGAKAPDFNLPGVDRRYYSLKDFSEYDVLVIIFTCNHCPTAQAYEDRIKSIVQDYKDRSVQVIGISPNSPLGLLYEELGYSDLGDTFEDMVLRADLHDFNFPYLYDGDTQTASLAYGPVATPHCFVFDRSRKLTYVGRLDGKEKPGTGNAEDLRSAIDQTLAGKTVDQPVTKTFGCSTKWGWKTKLRDKIDREWAEKEVRLDEIDLKELKNLMANDGDKLRLINVWATWCGPCRLEYPEFVVIQRMFGARDFEFVSVSADKLSNKDKALAFLRKAQSALTNYIVTNDDKYALIESVDSEWNGALPYTALVEPGGRIVWRHQGEVDFMKLKKTIVDHPKIGRVY